MALVPLMAIMALTAPAMVPPLAPVESLGNLVPARHGRIVSVFSMLALGQPPARHRVATTIPAALMARPALAMAPVPAIPAFAPIPAWMAVPLGALILICIAGIRLYRTVVFLIGLVGFSLIIGHPWLLWVSGII